MQQRCEVCAVGQCKDEDDCCLQRIGLRLRRIVLAMNGMKAAMGKQGGSTS